MLYQDKTKGEIANQIWVQKLSNMQLTKLTLNRNSSFHSGLRVCKGNGQVTINYAK